MHIAIIMDGNGRWARRRGRPRQLGHRAGADAVHRTVEASVRARVDTLTLYAFSCDNWVRPGTEVGSLMRLFKRYLLAETPRCIEQDVRLSVIGRRDRLDSKLLRIVERSERLTAGCAGLHLRIAIDYSARHSILAAAARVSSLSSCTYEDFARALDQVNHSACPTAPVDLLIRTGEEQRLSDFMLWECAYAELHFTPCMWPDFDEAALNRALDDFAQRERRFGRLIDPGRKEHSR